MFGLDVPSHWIILAVLLVAFFGYRKLPDMTRSVGRSLRIFKSEMTAMTDDPSDGSSSHAPAVTPHLAAVAAEPTADPSSSR
jgi:sec-independent protein translocase protein TatA